MGEILRDLGPFLAFEPLWMVFSDIYEHILNKYAYKYMIEL